MSEDTFPFAEDGEARPYAEEGGRNRKAMLVAGGIAAALVVGAGAFLLLGGGDDTTETALIPRGRPAVAAPGVTKPVAKAVAKKLPAAYTERLGRDPFKALYVVPVAAPAAAAPAAPASTTAGTSGTSGSGTSTAGTTPTRYTIKLVSISKPSPETRFTTWTVAGTKTTVIPAQRFGKYGELVVLAFTKNAYGVVDSAIIQVGDDSPIDVKVGESVSVL